MTNREALLSLADTVEALSGPDADVDKSIWLAFGKCLHLNTTYEAVQGDCNPPRADLYMWSKPEDTLEGQAATRLEALQAQPVGEESGWLIEENASGIIFWIALAENEWPRTEIHVRRARSGRDMMVETDKYRSPVVRVKDANEALRFARKEDAEALIKLFDRFLLCPVATEHMWCAA